MASLQFIQQNTSDTLWWIETNLLNFWILLLFLVLIEKFFVLIRVRATRREAGLAFWMRRMAADRCDVEWVKRLRGSRRTKERCDQLQPAESRWIFCLSLLHRLIRLLLWPSSASPSPPLLHHHLLLLSFPPLDSSLSLCPGLADRDPRVRPAGCGRHAAGQQGETSLPARRATGRQMDSWRKRRRRDDGGAVKWVWRKGRRLTLSLSGFFWNVAQGKVGPS